MGDERKRAKQWGTFCEYKKATWGFAECAKEQMSKIKMGQDVREINACATY